MAITISAATHVGRVRKNNEDAHYHEAVSGADGCYLGLVSDGVGGKNYGEVASGMTVNTFSSLNQEGKLAITDDANMRGPMLDMSARRAHQDIADASKTNPEYSGMACTLVSVIANDSTVGWVNVGDSRLYHLRGDQLTQISEDQTYARALFKEGRITQAELDIHPDRNTLMYCLGVESVNAPIEPQSGLFDWATGDKLLLCSDGLTDMVTDAQIQDILCEQTLSEQTHQQAADALVEAALDGGGKDNITLVILVNEQSLVEKR